MLVWFYMFGLPALAWSQEVVTGHSDEVTVMHLPVALQFSTRTATKRVVILATLYLIYFIPTFPRPVCRYGQTIHENLPHSSDLRTIYELFWRKIQVCKGNQMFVCLESFVAVRTRGGSSTQFGRHHMPLMSCASRREDTFVSIRTSNCSTNVTYVNLSSRTSPSPFEHVLFVVSHQERM